MILLPLLLLSAAHRWRAAIAAVVRVRWLLLGLAIAVLLPDLLRLELRPAAALLEALARSWGPLLLMVIAVALWILPHDAEALAAALARLLSPLESLLPVGRGCAALAAVLHALPALLERVTALRGQSGDPMANLTGLYLSLERGELEAPSP